MARAINIDKAIEKLEAYKDEANMRIGNLDNYDDGDADDAYWCGYRSGVIDCIYCLDESDWVDMEPVTRCHDCKHRDEYIRYPPGLDNIGERLCNLTDSVVDEDFFL